MAKQTAAWKMPGKLKNLKAPQLAELLTQAKMHHDRLSLDLSLLKVDARQIHKELNRRQGTDTSWFGDPGSVVGNGRKASKKGGTRTRATAGEIEERTKALDTALKGTKPGKGIAMSDLAEKAKIDAKHLRPLLMKGKNKTYGMDGSKRSATWYAKG